MSRPTTAQPIPRSTARGRFRPPEDQFDVLELAVGPQPPDLFVHRAAERSRRSRIQLRVGIRLRITRRRPAPPPIGSAAARPRGALRQQTPMLRRPTRREVRTRRPSEMSVKARRADRKRVNPVSLYDIRAATQVRIRTSAADPALPTHGRWSRGLGQSPAAVPAGRDPTDFRKRSLEFRDFGLAGGAERAWEHRGFDLVNDRPRVDHGGGERHMVCWRRLSMAVRSQRKPDPGTRSGRSPDEPLQLRAWHPRSSGRVWPRTPASDVGPLGVPLSRARPLGRAGKPRPTRCHFQGSIWIESTIAASWA